MVKHSLNSLNKTGIFGINIMISKFLFNDSFHKSKITKVVKPQIPNQLGHFSSIYYEWTGLLASFYRIMIK